MKLNKDQQAAVNEIAKNAFIADVFGKLKGNIVKENKTFIDDHEAEFRGGVPAEFEYEGHKIKCKLTMTPAPKWSAKDVVVCELRSGDFAAAREAHEPCRVVGRAPRARRKTNKTTNNRKENDYGRQA